MRKRNRYATYFRGQRQLLILALLRRCTNIKNGCSRSPLLLLVVLPRLIVVVRCALVTLLWVLLLLMMMLLLLL